MEERARARKRKAAVKVRIQKGLLGIMLLGLCACGFLFFHKGGGVPAAYVVGQRKERAQTDGNGGKWKERKKIAITFDDGPHGKYTGMLLDGLKKRGVAATFFVTGSNVKKNPELIKRMQEEGHLIGNHTYSHMQLRKNNREEFKTELIKTSEAIREITGEDVVYVRPPYGSWDKSFEKELNMFPVLWTVDPLDWASHDADGVVQKVLIKAKENDIILMHDCYETSVTAALGIVDALQKEGYEFVTVEELLLD